MQVRYYSAVKQLTWIREVIVPPEQSIFSSTIINRIRKVCEAMHLIFYTDRSGIPSTQEAAFAGRIPDFEWTVPEEILDEGP